MATPAQPVRATSARRRRAWVKLETAAIALLTVAVCVGLGLRARARAAATRVEVDRLRSVMSSIQQFQASFRPITPSERQQWAAQPDSGHVAIAPEDRLGLAETIARLAESSGLENPRVSFGSADTTVAPRQLEGVDAALGDYTITIDAGGGFAELLTFVNALPVAVSVARLDGTRDSSRARFHVTLAVYENKSASHS